MTRVNKLSILSMMEAKEAFDLILKLPKNEDNKMLSRDEFRACIAIIHNVASRHAADLDVAIRSAIKELSPEETKELQSERIPYFAN